MEKGMGGTLGFLAVLSPWELCLARSYMKPAQSISCRQNAQILRSQPRTLCHRPSGLVCALPLFFEVAIVLLISLLSQWRATPVRTW